jgi:hypothetical protein
VGIAHWGTHMDLNPQFIENLKTIDTAELRQYLCEQEGQFNTASEMLLKDGMMFCQVFSKEDSLAQFLPDTSVVMIAIRFLNSYLFKTLISRELFNRDEWEPLEKEWDEKDFPIIESICKKYKFSKQVFFGCAIARAITLNDHDNDLSSHDIANEADLCSDKIIKALNMI